MFFTPPSSKLLPLYSYALLSALVLCTFGMLYSLATAEAGLLFAFLDGCKTVGAVMIGWSNLLSGASYYFDFLDRELGKRKYIGVAGFCGAVCYAVGASLYLPEVIVGHAIANTLAALAFMILIIVVFASNTTIKLRMGYKRHRYLLRTTYVAYGLFLVREYLLSHTAWTAWFFGLPALPPLSLVLSCFALIVIVARLSMLVHMWWKSA